ncbi:uncharacterized protein EDB91DRAFT_1123918 [Suillus paluster]|uniref:uncharacterized protein n=1 Tax=Suillus paluster TaxID=48578 RepID=UPI001B8667F0|nr:uncharacterized protein EDB91DRAFT_1123918 [Suillus paluster]KAG1744696.1 hypothetical protein EDB91DRAFT_1123918 [Suillus paluster]
MQAIAMMIGERITLVQGPPGTGKTKTIIEAEKCTRKTTRTFSRLNCDWTETFLVPLCLCVESL